MKVTTITRLIVAAVLLGSSATVLMAQNVSPACPVGNEPGYGWSLSSEQRAEQRGARRQYRQNRAKGAMTAEEQAWRKQAQRRGGMSVTGTPRGRGEGKRQRGGNGAGQGMRQGLRDGTGPRSVDGTCANGDSPRRRGRR